MSIHVAQGLVNVPIQRITQLLGIFHLQQMFEGHQEQGHVPTSVVRKTNPVALLTSLGPTP